MGVTRRWSVPLWALRGHCRPGVYTCLHPRREPPAPSYHHDSHQRHHGAVQPSEAQVSLIRRVARVRGTCIIFVIGILGSLEANNTMIVRTESWVWCVSDSLTVFIFWLLRIRAKTTSENLSIIHGVFLWVVLMTRWVSAHVTPASVQKKIWQIFSFDSNGRFLRQPLKTCHIRFWVAMNLGGCHTLSSVNVTIADTESTVTPSLNISTEPFISFPSLLVSDISCWHNKFLHCLFCR